MDHVPTDPTPRKDPMVGALVADRYRVLAPLSRGGMGQVYRGEQVALGRPVALKVLDLHRTDEDAHQIESRFLKEAAYLAELTHPHTVRVIDYGQWGGRSFLVMEFIDGVTLHQLTRRTRLDPLRLVELALQVGGALAEAHDKGLVHRDLKPSNILVRRGPEGGDDVKVIDFGLVKRIGDDADEEVTQAGMLVGTPSYLAPEIIRGEPVTASVDVYALGVLMYRCLTGTTPFRKSTRGNTPALLHAILNEDPLPFDASAPGLVLPGALEWTVRTCLAKSPEARFADMRELTRALRACRRALREAPTPPLTLSITQGVVHIPEGYAEPSQPTLSLADVGPPHPTQPSPTQPSPTQPSITVSLPPPRARRWLAAALLLGLMGVLLTGAALWPWLSGPASPADAAAGPGDRDPSLPPRPAALQDDGTARTPASAASSDDGAGADRAAETPTSGTAPAAEPQAAPAPEPSEAEPAPPSVVPPAARPAPPAAAPPPPVPAPEAPSDAPADAADASPPTDDAPAPDDGGADDAPADDGGDAFDIDDNDLVDPWAD